MSRAVTVPVSSRMRSASVDLPWSMWAMIEKLRMWSRSIFRPYTSGRSGSALVLSGHGRLGLLGRHRRSARPRRSSRLTTDSSSTRSSWAAPR